MHSGARALALTRTCSQTHTPTITLARARTHPPTTCARAWSHTPTRARSHARTYTHARTHTRAHGRCQYARNRTRTQAHARTQVVVKLRPSRSKVTATVANKNGGSRYAVCKCQCASVQHAFLCFNTLQPVRPHPQRNAPATELTLTPPHNRTQLHAPTPASTHEHRRTNPHTHPHTPIHTQRRTRRARAHTPTRTHSHLETKALAYTRRSSNGRKRTETKVLATPTSTHRPRKRCGRHRARTTASTRAHDRPTLAWWV